MSVTLPSAEEKHDSPVTVLGDLLQAHQGRLESEWVGLVEAIAAGDQLALRVLYGRSHRLVFTLIMRLLQNRASAEEVTVDVFHDVWRRAATYDSSGGTVVGWIMNQARSRAIDRLRFEHRKKRAPASAPTGDGESRAPDSAEAHLNSRDQGRVLQGALGVLTAPEREAIEAAFFGESSYSQVAASLNEPVGTIKTRIRSGLLKMREALGPQEGEL